MPRRRDTTSGDDKPENVGRATIFDVAAAAGVSIKTVSRVVNNEARVRDKTRARVQEAIASLDYRPNTAARGLSSKRSFVVGLIYENAEEYSYMKHLLGGALGVCDEHGYTLLLRPLNLPGTRLRQQVRQFLAQTSVAGVVLPAPVGDLPDVYRVLEDLSVPYVTIKPRQTHAEIAQVDCDDEQASYELTRVLLGEGHQCIGYISGHPDHVASAQRLHGYRRALNEQGLALRTEWIAQGYFDFASGRQAASQLLDANASLTALLAANDDMAAGAVFEARERGLDVPGELSIAGFDDTPIASHVWPRLTTARQPIAEMAAMATRQLIAHLGGADHLPAQTFACEVVVRDSVGACHASRAP